MSIQDVQVKQSKAIADAGDLLVKLLVDIKAKKDMGAIVSDVLQPLVAVVGEVGDFKADLDADRKSALSTLGSKMGELADALLG